MKLSPPMKTELLHILSLKTHGGNFKQLVCALSGSDNFTRIFLIFRIPLFIFLFRVKMFVIFYHPLIPKMG